MSYQLPLAPPVAGRGTGAAASGDDSPSDPGPFDYFDELLAKMMSTDQAADNFMALKCHQVKPPEPLRPRYAMFYITMDLLAVTLIYILRSAEKTVYESIGAPLPGDSRIVQLVCHRQHMLLGIVLYSSAYAELMPDDPVPVLDVLVIGTVAREVKLTELLQPSLN